jgi:hypothetical protein
MPAEMNTLEPEYRELNAAGVIDESTTARAIALDRGAVFSVFEEIRFTLYGAVTAVTAGIGLLLKQNLDRIGPLTLIIVLLLVAALCYTSAIRTRRRQAARSIGGDYVLLLGALIVSADVGYAESQFHWLGAHWAWYLLVLSAWHAATAYALDSRLVLSVSLTSLAAWFGVDGPVAGLLQTEAVLRNSGIEAMLCAGVMLLWRTIHAALDGPEHFVEVFEHFAANLGFWGLLVLCGSPGSRASATAFLLVCAVVCVYQGLRTRRQAFIIYGVGYTALGLCIIEAQFVSEAVTIAALALGIVVAALVLLWQLHLRLKEVAA